MLTFSSEWVNEPQHNKVIGTVEVESTQRISALPVSNRRGQSSGGNLRRGWASSVGSGIADRKWLKISHWNFDCFEWKTTELAPPDPRDPREPWAADTVSGNNTNPPSSSNGTLRDSISNSSTASSGQLLPQVNNLLLSNCPPQFTILANTVSSPPTRWVHALMLFEQALRLVQTKNQSLWDQPVQFWQSVPSRTFPIHLP